MFSGFSSYLGFNPQGSESVQALLQKTDLCLDELLDDEGLLTELKTQNEELLSFLKADENFTKMLNHVIREPSADEQQLNPQRCFKFPLVSTDVLSSECAIVQYLLNCNESNKDSNTSQTSDQDGSPSAKEAANQQKPDKENNENPKYLDYLFTLLDTKELNYTAAGYFAKIVANLCEKHSAEFFAYIYKKRPEHLEKLTNHVSSESIADLLFRILSFEVNMVDGPNDEIYTIKRAETLQSLAKKLDGEHNQELASGAAYVVSEVIDKSTAIHKGDEIIACLIETAPIEELYRLLKTKNPTTVSAVTTVLGKMFANHIVMALETDEEEDDNFGTQEDPKLSSDLPLVAVTIQNVQAIVSIIAEAQEGNAGFGSFRMKLLDLMGSCLEANNVDINAKIVESGFFKVALNLLLKFEWNNILHNKVEALVNDVFSKEYENLKVSLFENAQVLNTIIEAFHVTEIPITGKKTEKKIRRGYLGQIIKIANKINDSSEDPVVKKYLENNTAWEEFVVVELEEVNKKNRVKLGGVNPKFERCGSFEVQHWSTMTCMQTSKVPLDSEEQQNNQEGLPEIEKIKLEEGMPPTITISSDDSDQGPKLSKFSQVGAAEKLIRRRSSRDQSAELEILAEKLGRRKSSKEFEMDIPEESDQILTTKSLHLKFSQLGAAGKLARRRSSAKEAGEDEIAEEVVDTTASPMLPGGLKFFKFEEIIDESIEENIQAEQDTGDEPSNPVKGLKIPLKFM